MKKRKINYKLILLTIILLFLIISNIYFIYSLISLSGIETLIRILIIVILILLLICFSIRYLRSCFLKKKSYIIYSIFLIIYSILCLIIGIVIRNTLNTLDNLTSEKTTYSVSLVALNNNEIQTVGMLSNNSSIETELINQMINEMWKSVPEDGLFGKSQEQEYFQEMLNTEIAKEISMGNGLGIQDMVIAELEKKK